MTGTTANNTSATRIPLMLLLLLLPVVSGKTSGQQAYSDTLLYELGKAKTMYEKVNIELQLAYIYTDINADSLKHYAERVIRHSKQMKNDTLLCHGYLKYAMLFYNFPKTRFIDSTWYYIDKAYTIARKAGYLREMASCYELKGMVKSNTADKEGAINDLLEAKKYFFQSGDTSASYLVAFSIAQTYEAAGIYDKAFALYDSIGELKALQKLNFYVSFLEIVGSSYQKVKQFEKSLEYYKKAYAYLMVAGDNCEKHRILMKMASAYHYLGNKDSAELYFNKTISYSDSCRVDNRLGNDCVRLADICFDNKRYSEAESYYLQSLDIVRQNGWTDSEMYTLHRLSNFYQNTRNYAKALDYLQQYIHLKDSLKIEPLGPMLEKAMSDQELAAKQAELEKLKKEQAGMIKQNYIIVVISVIALLLFLSIWYFLAGILFNFAKTKLTASTGLSKTFWNYAPPPTAPGNIKRMLSALLFACLNLGAYLIFFNEKPDILALVCWSATTLLLVYGAERVFFRYCNKNKNLTFKKELLLLLSSLLPFSILLTAVASMLKLVDFSFEQHFYFALLIITSLCVTLSVNILIQYRMQFDILSESMIEGFNRKLAEWKLNIARQQEENQEEPTYVSIDNAGKNVVINLNLLLYIVSDNIYQEFVCIDGTKINKILIRSTLSNVEKKLSDHENYLRCHRSYIINTNKITSIIRQSRQFYFVLEKSNQKIPISKAFEDSMLEKFGYFLRN